MGQTLIEKIISRHSENDVRPGEIADVVIDVRVARDFGGANVVKNLEQAGLTVADPGKTLFTFDTNPGGSDQGYAANQQFCREYARKHGIGLKDITQGIGTHLAIDEGLVGPGSTFISTDSHANIMGAIGAFGQGMGDQDIAAAWANGSIWFKSSSRELPVPWLEPRTLSWPWPGSWVPADCWAAPRKFMETLSTTCLWLIASPLPACARKWAASSHCSHPTTR